MDEFERAAGDLFYRFLAMTRPEADADARSLDPDSTPRKTSSSSPRPTRPRSPRRIRANLFDEEAGSG